MEGVVYRSTGSWYEVKCAEGIIKARLRGKMRLEELKVTNPIAVGDRVRLETDSLQEEGTALISEVLPRNNYLVRKSTHKNHHGQLIAANLDQCMLIATLVFPRTSMGFIDRFLVSVEAFRIPTVLVFNKTDLLEPEGLELLNELCKDYENIGYPTLQISAMQGNGIDAVKATLKGKRTLISGHSGVGKSTMINALAPHLLLRTGEVSSFANKGIHTTTFAEMFDLDEDTALIDTPGIKELGLMEIGEEELGHYFPEMRALLNQCRFHNCRHLAEPGCAVIEAVEQGKIKDWRYHSYLSMFEDSDNRR